MADWTINSGSNPSHGRAAAGAGTPRIRYFQESTAASTAVIKYGDIVSFDTVVSSASFRIRRSPAGGGTGANLLLSNALVGVATEASTSDGSTRGLADVNARRIGVALADAATEFVGYLSAGAADSTLIGLQKAVRYDSTNQVYLVDSTNSTTALAFVTITGLVRGTEGDTNGPVYFKFLSSNISAAVL